ncbi:FecR domain-containing protein [Fulvivirgaceae bacterium BMA10]|uniref:FecR domain-containing protein n=1 Tax=Splendidivirga corallicola TaxID=3051826 RepID=A0ABT8KN12_9BACT|nr:FecR domain-containing protein [Fulvivirgaceae bacterium BMA10]
MNEQELRSLIDKYLKEECSEQESQLLESFINSYQSDFIEHWNEETLGKKKEFKDQLFQDIRNKINEDNSASIPKRASLLNRSVRIAASIIIILGAAFFAYFLPQLSNEPEEIAWELTKTELGQKRFVTLKDGTIVHLNAGSSIEYPSEFSPDKRSIILNGEAYFDVAKDPARPFQIKTNDLLTTVLGTKFNIRAYEDEKTTEVAVVSGKVSVQKIGSSQGGFTADSEILLPTEMVIYSKSSQDTEKRNFEYMEIFAWKDKIIYFKNADIHEILQKLERWYGITFLVNSELDEDKDFSGRFQNKSLESVLEGLSFVFNFQFEINDKIVTLK